MTINKGLQTAKQVPDDAQVRGLAEVCAMVRGTLTDEEIDTIFRRDPSSDRPVDLA